MVVQESSTTEISAQQILIIDDSPDNLRLLKRLLAREGYQIFFAKSGEQGIRTALTVQPDLILLDVLLPKMNGFEICKELKDHQDTWSIPIIFMTSLTDTQDKIRGFELGAVDYITKPIHAQELLARVKTQLAIDQMQRQLKQRNHQLAQEVQERREAQHHLAQLTTRYELILDAAGEGIYGMDLQGQVTFINPAALALLGYQLDDLIGQNIHPIIHHTKNDGTSYSIEDCPIYAAFKDSQVHCNEEEFFWKKDGQPFPVHYMATPVRDFKGEVTGSVVIFHDISERKRTEQRIQEAHNALEQRVIDRTNALVHSLKEKETLLQEVHHRVNNNLQVISSLLGLQAAQFEHPSCVAALMDCRHRIKAMALVHEQLYGTQNVGHLDTRAYFHALVANLVDTYRSQENPIPFTIHATGITLDLDQAIPCGLMVTELVSNCLKHAFPNNGQGHISIGVESTEDKQYRLWVQDTGIGFPKDADFRTLNSLGLQLVINLCEHQLGGTIKMEKQNGTTITVTFPMEETEPVTQ